MASRLLTRVNVREILDAHLARIEDGMAIPEILKRLAELGRSDLSNFVIHKTRVEVHDPLKPLVALAKIRGILGDGDVTPPPPRDLVSRQRGYLHRNAGRDPHSFKHGPSRRQDRPASQGRGFLARCSTQPGFVPSPS
jgi:hypothetical protein